MDFIFMLTRDDRTVANSLAVLESVRALGLRDVGVKDAGIDRMTLGAVVKEAHAQGARCWLETVDEDPGAALMAARMAVEAGADGLLGGKRDPEILAILHQAGRAYFPLAGRAQGRPAHLEGTAEDIAADCEAAVEMGCVGVNLLAWRSVSADPLELVQVAREALAGRGRLVVAGGIHSPEQVHALRTAGADAFTVGTAIFDARFAPERGALIPQLEAVLEACAQVASR